VALTPKLSCTLLKRLRKPTTGELQPQCCRTAVDEQLLAEWEIPPGAAAPNGSCGRTQGMRAAWNTLLKRGWIQKPIIGLAGQPAHSRAFRGSFGLTPFLHEAPPECEATALSKRQGFTTDILARFRLTTDGCFNRTDFTGRNGRRGAQFSVVETQRRALSIPTISKANLAGGGGSIKPKFRTGARAQGMNRGAGWALSS